jgi:cytoskeletal protein RodZ
MESFGNSLRQQREFRSIPLEEIAETTMINLRFLQAIENGDFHDLPHPTFVKGFLRAYARHLGLDGDEVVLGYEQVLLSQQEGEEEPQQVEEKDLEPAKKLPFPLLLGGSLLLALLLLGLALWSGKDSPQPGKQTPAEPAEQAAPAATRERKSGEGLNADH